MPQINDCKPKVLILSPTPCYPLTHGGAIGQYYIIDGLKDQVDFIFCTVSDSPKALNDLKSLQSVQPNLKIYFVNTKKQSVFNKLKNVIKFPYSIIKFLALNLRKNTNDDFLNAGFISINTNINETYILLVNEIIKKENIALVQLDFFDTMPFALIIPEDIKKLFVCHELRYKRLELAAKPVRSRMHIKNLLLTECSSMKKTSCKRWIVS